MNRKRCLCLCHYFEGCKAAYLIEITHGSLKGKGSGQDGKLHTAVQTLHKWQDRALFLHRRPDGFYVSDDRGGQTAQWLMGFFFFSQELTSMVTAHGVTYFEYTMLGWRRQDEACHLVMAGLFNIPLFCLDTLGCYCKRNIIQHLINEKKILPNLIFPLVHLCSKTCNFKTISPRFCLLGCCN